MTSVAIVAAVWPFLMFGLVVAGVMAFHRLLDRREQRHHGAE